MSLSYCLCALVPAASVASDKQTAASPPRQEGLLAADRYSRLCVSVCECVCECVSVWVSVCVCVSVCECVCVNVCVSECVWVWVCVHVWHVTYTVSSSIALLVSKPPHSAVTPLNSNSNSSCNQLLADEEVDSDEPKASNTALTVLSYIDTVSIAVHTH